MTCVVWKFPLKVIEVQFLSMPPAANILCVQMQFGVPTLWALVDPTSTGYQPITAVYMIGTGHVVNLPEGSVYRGTVQESGGSLVRHCFTRAQ